MRFRDGAVASMYRDLELISRVSWSTPPQGLNAHATTGPRPYNWMQVLGEAPPESRRLFIGKLNAASTLGLPTDTVTLLDYSVMTLRGKSRRSASSQILAVAAGTCMEHFVFLALLGHASSEDGQESLLEEIGANLGHVVNTNAVNALTRIRDQLGDSARDTSIAPHYVADVVSQLGIRRVLSHFGGT